MADHTIPVECADGLCRVYLIEDDTALRAELTETLGDAGLTVFPFGLAEDFLAADVRDDLPGVIVSDMTMPGVSGIALFEAIRERGLETPLVFISGYSEPNQIIDGMKLGAVDFLWKPFKSEALLQAVFKALAQDVAQRAGDNQNSDVEQRWAKLTEREQEVCRFILVGYGNKDLAVLLNIQADTANKHRMKVHKKMGVPGRPELMELLKNFKPARL